jgi:hypothetical protein
MPPVAFCVPWRPIGGIGPYQGTVASPMMYMLVTKPRNLHYRYCPLQYW